MYGVPEERHREGFVLQIRQVHAQSIRVWLIDRVVLRASPALPGPNEKAKFCQISDAGYTAEYVPVAIW